MPASTIFVSHRDGSPSSSTKVALSIATGGMSKNVFTDRSGKAVIEHTGSGTATVYVGGKKCGSFRAPGSFTVVI